MFGRRQSASRKSAAIEERFKQGYWELAPHRILAYFRPHGVLQLMVALLCLVFAVAYGLFVAGVLTWPLDLEAPTYVHVMTIVAALSAALIIGVRGWSGVSAWLKRAQGRRAGDVAMADFAWNPAGISDQAHVEPLRRLWWAVFQALLIVPVFWWLFLSDKDAWWLALLFIGLAVGLFIMSALSVAQLPSYLRDGRGTLTFECFPFHPGDKLRVHFTPNKYPNPRFTLRFVDQATPEDTKSYGGLALRHSARVLPVIHALDDEVLIEFELPGDAALTTSMSGPKLRYWELRVDVQSPKYDYETSFPLPVYPHAVKAESTDAQVA